MSKIRKLFAGKMLILALTFSLGAKMYAQKQFKSSVIAFYNVENLFDTIVSAGYIDGTLPYTDDKYHISIPVSEINKYDTVYYRGPYEYEKLEGKKVIRPLILQDTEFSPKGTKVWNTEKYNQKLKNLSKVISEIGRDVSKTAPVIVGLSEIETREVIEDLVNQPALKPYNYGVAHFNSFDARGVDIGLIYQKDRFKLTEAKPYEVYLYRSDGSRRYTRHILRVSGYLDGEMMHFLVAHWPSRSGGEKVSMPNRMEAARVTKSIFDEIRKEDPKAKIMAMGDFNDDPTSPSIKEGIGALGEPKKVRDSDIYNPMEKMHKKGMGSLAYRDSWNLFDQIFMTGTLVDNSNKYETYKLYKAGIYSPAYLISKTGQYKGYPNRMFGGDSYHADGYSDHFPVYTILLKEISD